MKESDIEMMIEGDDVKCALLQNGSLGNDSPRVKAQPQKSTWPIIIKTSRAHVRLDFEPFPCSEPFVSNEHDFERRFRMLRSIPKRICFAVIRKGIFRFRRDATKKLGTHSYLYIIAALRTVALVVTLVCEKFGEEFL